MNLGITKTAAVQGTLRRTSLFYGSARDAMHDFLRNTLKSSGDAVLLPAYIGWSQNEGSGVFDPVSKVGARVGFYDLNSDLSANIDDVENQLRAGRYRVIVVIHYFGRTDPGLPKLRQIADRHGAVLVEDLAHGFFTALGNGPAGKYGHLNLYSLHKMFPLEDGGAASYSDATLVTGQAQTRPDLAATVIEYDWNAIANRRRDNFEALTSELKSLPEYGQLFELMWPELNGNDVPQTLPVRIVGDVRNAIYAGMNADGFGMVSLYHTLIPEVRDGFKELNDLADHVINFPVHQDVDIELIAPMVESFKIHLLGDTARRVLENPVKS
jgi:dTDP-4-amino-4,6-dideoxygalactose transaminase